MVPTEDMTGTVLYDDGRVVLDEDGLTLRHYYFPFGTSKRIAYRDIRHVQVLPMTWLTGKGRGWGTTNPRYWLPLDTNRPHKDTLFVLDLGRLVKPGFSPEDPDRVLGILRRKAPTAVS